MAGNASFSKFQYGKESTRGTAVAATRILRGVTDMPEVGSDSALYYPREHVGVRAPSIRSTKGNLFYANTLPISEGHFQVLPWLFGCLLKGGVSASETTGGQGDYAWNQSPSMTADNAVDSSTLEMGDDQQCWEVEYMMFDRVRISGKVNQNADFSPVKIDASFFARQMTKTSFTAALSVGGFEPMNAKLSRIYIDTTWAGVRSTEKTNFLREFDIEIIGGCYPLFSGSGERYFNSHAQGDIEVNANFIFENDSQAIAIHDAHRANTMQVVRFKISGDQIGSGVNHSLTLDISGSWEKVSPLASKDKASTLTSAILRGYYDTTGAKMLQVNTVTSVNAY